MFSDAYPFWVRRQPFTQKNQMRKSILIAALLSANACFASVINYTVTGAFTSSPSPSSIAVGDPFSIQFSLDNSAQTFAGGGVGFAADAIDNLTFSLQAGATGSYSGGSLTTPQSIVMYDNVAIGSGQDWIYMFMTSGLNFPAIDGHVVNELRMGFQSNSSSVFDLSTVSGSGQSLDSVVGSDPLNLATYDYAAYIYIAMDNNTNFAFANITSIESSSASVPEVFSTACYLFPLGLIGLFARHLRTVKTAKIFAAY